MRPRPAFFALFLFAGCSSDDGSVETKTASMTAGAQVITFPTRPLSDIPIAAFKDPIDQKIALTGLPVAGRYEPCVRQLAIDGEKVTTHLPTEQCVLMDEPKVWHGRWVNQYENSVFCPTGAKQMECDGAKAEIWLTSGPLNGEYGQSYSVSFVGRKTKYDGGYGHLSSYPAEIVVDRVISIKNDSALQD